MSEIKAVTFDVGGTLAKGGLDRRLYGLKMTGYLRSLGFDTTISDYRTAVGKALDELNKLRRELLEMRFEDFCLITLQNLNVTSNEEILGKMRSLYFECFPQTRLAGSKEVLSKLSGEYELGVISNSMSLASRRFLEDRGLAKYFKAFAVSGEVGYRKPHPRIFEFALEELGVKPEEAVHVGDLLEEDIAGAKGVGMYSVLVSPKGLGEAEVKPDLVVGSIREVPSAVASISSPELREIKGLLGDRCWICSSESVGLFKLDPEGGDEVDNFVLLCPKCRGETLRERPLRPRKRGKYRAVYRHAWAKLRTGSGRLYPV